MTSRIYFGKMNSTLGSVVPLAMFQYKTVQSVHGFIHIVKVIHKWQSVKSIFMKSDLRHMRTEFMVHMVLSNRPVPFSVQL